MHETLGAHPIANLWNAPLAKGWRKHLPRDYTSPIFVEEKKEKQIKKVNKEIKGIFCL